MSYNPFGYNIGQWGNTPQPLKSTFGIGNLPQSANMGIMKFNPKATMMGSGATVGYGDFSSKPKERFNPYSFKSAQNAGVSMLGNIGGGQRAVIGNDVWETGGTLSGTGVGNASNTLGNVADQFGPTGKIIGMGLKGAADIINIAKYNPEVGDIDTGDQLMQEGGPSLDIGSEIKTAGGIKKQGDKLAGQGALAGAKTGGAIGSIFGPVGTAIGGLVGGIGGFLLGKNRKKRAHSAYEKAMGEVDETTGEFNKANIASSQDEFGQMVRADRMTKERNPNIVSRNNPFMV